MSVWQRISDFLTENNMKQLAFIGMLVATVLGGSWKVYTYYHPTASQINEEVIKEQRIEGENFLNTGRYDDAKQLFEQVIKASPDDDQALWGLKIAGVKSTATPAAFKLAIGNLYREKPKDAHVNLLLGEFYAINEHELDKAGGFYQTAIKQNPKLAEAYFDLAGVYFEQRQWAAARDAGLQAVALSETPKYQALLAAVYVKQRLYDDALREYSKISGYPFAALESARIYWLRKQWPEAANLQNKAIGWLDDKTVMAQAENQEFWSFEIAVTQNPTQKQGTRLTKPDEKKAYAVFCLSVSLFLQGDAAGAEKLLAQLSAVNSGDIKAIIRADLAELVKSRPDLAEQVATYEQRYLS